MENTAAEVVLSAGSVRHHLWQTVPTPINETGLAHKIPDSPQVRSFTEHFQSTSLVPAFLPPASPARRLHHRRHATEPFSAHQSSPSSPRDATEPMVPVLIFAKVWANSCPNFRVHIGLVSEFTAIPRKAMRSTISRKLRVNRNYRQTTWPLTSGGNR